MGQILGIDPAKACGWAVIDPENSLLLDCGEWNWQKVKDRGELFLAFESKIYSAFHEFSVNHIVLENAHLRGYWAAYYPIVMHGIVDMLCSKWEIQSTKVRAPMWRKQVLGKGNADKQDAVDFVSRTYGVSLKSDNAADAVCIAHYKESK